MIPSTEKVLTDNDRAITVESTKKLLYDLFEVIGFNIVVLGGDIEGKLGAKDKWGYGYPNGIFVDPKILLDKHSKQKLNYQILGAYGNGWPAHWRIGEHYLGAGSGTINHYYGNKNIPDFLQGAYHISNWEEQYNTQLNDALSKALLGEI